MAQEEPDAEAAEARGLRADPAVIEKLYREEYAWLERALRRHLPSPDDRADVAQESFTRIARYGWPEAVAHPRALLFKIALNIVRADAVSSRRRAAAAERPLETADGAAAAAWASAPDDRFTLAMLRRVLDEMPPRRRLVFLMHRAKGMKHAEIAAELGISVKAVEKHMVKATRAFRAKLGRGGEDP
jgi:RNA polymerase sigma-70 factor (ECF subfamily)